MLVQQCGCGQQYRLPDSAAGKKAKCKKCGAVFVVEAPRTNSPGTETSKAQAPRKTSPRTEAIRAESPRARPASRPTPSEGDDFLLAEFAAATQRAAMAPKPSPMEAASGDDGLALGSVSEEYEHGPATAAAPAEGARPEGYFQSLLWTFLFPTTPANLITFLIIWFFLCLSALVLQMAPFVGMVGQFIIFGWYSAFRFNVIAAAAGGEEELPSLSMSEGAMEDIVMPVLRWIGSWVIVLLPAIGHAAYAIQAGHLTGGDLLGALSGGVTGLLTSATGEMGLFVFLVYAGLFVWPIVALCVALSGFESLQRVDLIVLTILRTLPGYVPTVILVFGSAWLDQWLSGLVGAQMVGGKKQLSAVMTSFALWVVLAAAIELYFEIVAMRAIGLYYRHFKHRFAWDWG